MSKFAEKQTVLEELKNLAHSFWGFLVFNRRMAIVIAIIVLITGIFSYRSMPKEANPEVTVPMAIVITPYPGASPNEVADQVSFEIEKELKSLEKVKRMSSTSSEGISQIIVEFDANADMDKSIRKLKDKVDQAKADLPEDAEDPIVEEASFSNRPVINFGFTGNVDYERLLTIVEDAQDELENLSGVQRADIIGKKQKHVLVKVREADMRKHNLNLRAISRAIRSFHLNSPVGNLEIDDMLYRIRIESEQDTAEKISNIPIASINDATIYIKDVADINEEYAEDTTLSRISINQTPSQTAISLSLVKSSGANIIKTVNAAKAKIKEMQLSGLIPSEVEILYVNDMSKFVQQDFDNLVGSGKQTLFLIVLILLLVLGFKEALIAGISIPLTFLVTFTYLKYTGNTLNGVVLFSLVLGLGLLVDTTIVMMEGIHDFIYNKKLSPINAVLKTIQAFRYPLISGALTTIAAFTPMLMMSGIMGQFFAYIPRTVNTVLISSLFIGLLMIPAFAVLFMERNSANSACESKLHNIIKNKLVVFKKFTKTRDRLFNTTKAKYKNILNYYLGPKKHRTTLYLISFIVFISAMALPVMRLVDVRAFPIIDVEFMYIDIEAPVGTSLQKTDAIVQKAEAIVRQNMNVESYMVYIGTGTNNINDLVSTTGNTHIASIIVNFIPEKNRKKKSYEIGEDFKKEFTQITEAEIKVPEIGAGPPTETAIKVAIFGEDYGILKQIVSDVKAELVHLGADQVDDDINTGTAEFTFNFKDPHQKALLKNYDLTVADIAQEVRMAAYPTKVATIKRGEEEININIQKNWGKGNFKPNDIEAIKQIPIQNSAGEYINLGNILEPQIGASLNAIRHYDGKRVASALAEGTKKKSAERIQTELTPFLKNYNWPKGYNYKLIGGNEDARQAFLDLFNALFLGILLIFLILVTQFNSFKQPFIIMTALPLSMIGVLYGYMIFDLDLGVGAIIGIVALAGIVVNDAIILIDRINVNRRQHNMSLKEAIQEAGPARMQPIIITSVTTVLGVLPITLQDEFWVTLGSAIIFGMMFSTILTLLIIPCLYYSFESKKDIKSTNN